MHIQTESRAAPRPTRSVALFGIGSPDYWRLWYVGLVIFTVRWLESVAVGVFVFQQTRSAVLVATMMLLRLVPLGLFGAFLGAWAEKIQRRSALQAVVALMMVTSGTLALLAYTGHLAVWHLAVASFVNGLGWATDNPVRRVMIGEAAGAEKLGVAMSMDVGANNASRMLGPTVGGLMLATIGLDGAFLVSVLLYATALFAAFRVRYGNAVATGPTAVLERIAEGLRLVKHDPTMIGVLVITVIFNVFAWSFTGIIPVIGKQQLHLGPAGVGIFASMDGVGAFVGALLLAFFARPSLYGRTFVAGVFIYHAMMIACALSPNPFLAGAALALTGLAQSGFATMQATLVYLAAPPEMRSRLLGVLSVCIGVGPVGFFGVGLLADAIGARWATVATALAGLLALGVTRKLWRNI